MLRLFSRCNATLFRFIRYLILLLTLSVYGVAIAELLNINPSFPVIAYNNQGKLSYSASTGVFSVDATPLLIRISESSLPVAISPMSNGPADVLINFSVDSFGSLIGGVPGGDIVITGSVNLPDLGTFSGTLLTGEITAFGFRDTGTTSDLYDFTFTLTGGVIRHLFPGETIGVTIVSEQSNFTGIFTVDFGGEAKGNIGLVSTPDQLVSALGDRVWEDLNNNGIQDCEDTNENGVIGDVIAGEENNPLLSDQGPECGGKENGGAGIAGVEVFLYQPDQFGDCSIPLPVPSQYTNSNGFYFFDNLAPGDYCVVFNINSLSSSFCDTEGFSLGSPKFTTANIGGNDDIDSDANPLNGSTDSVSLFAGEANYSLDAGIVCPAKLGNLVWLDADLNGLQNSESGVEGVSVGLYKCGVDGIPGTSDDVFTGETRVTNALGEYMFGAEPGVLDLPPGDYFLKFDPDTLPSGYSFTLPKNSDDNIDSDCLAPSGLTACTTLGSRGINLNQDCGIKPDCGLTIDKLCRIEEPVNTSSDAKCDGKLKQFTVTWTGDPITVSGLPNDAPGGVVNTNQEVTFFGPFASNDVFVNISGSVTGQSKFHMSCSDGDMDGASDTNDAQPQVTAIGRDCGKNQGDAKSNGDIDFINNWLLEGFVDNSDQVLDCTLDDNPASYAQECSFTLQQGPSCESLEGKPDSLTFRYTAGGCSESDNSQDTSKAVCSESTEGSVVSGPITIMYAGGDNDLTSESYTLSKTTVEVGEEFTISGGYRSNSYIMISDGSTSELNMFHTSCSQPLATGDVYGSLTLIGINGQTGGTKVNYQYSVKNTGVPLKDVFVEDSLLGKIGLPFDLGSGETKILNAGPVILNTSTTSVATVSSLSSSCSGSDTLTVNAIEPTCDIQVAFKELQDDKVKYNLTNTSQIMATLESFILNFPSEYSVIKEIKLDGTIYKASESELIVGPGVQISAEDWTSPDTYRRELEPGETRTLEIVFTVKSDGTHWDNVEEGSMLTFKEGCQVSLRLPNACDIDRPTELVFEYTANACSSTTNYQEGKFECESGTEGSIGSLAEVTMTKDEDKFAVQQSGSEVRIFRSDEIGKEFPSEIKYNIIGSEGSQAHVLHSSCSKPLNLGDQFGALTLKEFKPRTN